MKRAIDFLAALFGLIVLAPLLAAIAVAVRVSMGSPVLFRQVRPGLRGRPFTIVKFRTMRDAYDAAGNPRPDAERMTAVGRILRATSLDELPELWNVMKGEMSLVGPRPLLMEYLPLYTPEQARRHEVRPGITGWAQVNGRNALDWDDRFRLDVWYVDNRSLLLDLRILLRTVKKVFVREGISQRGHVTMTPFRGTAEDRETSAADGAGPGGSGPDGDTAARTGDRAAGPAGRPDDDPVGGPANASLDDSLDDSVDGTVDDSVDDSVTAR